MREVVLVAPLRPYLVDDGAPELLQLGGVMRSVRTEIEGLGPVGDELVDFEEGRVDVDALHEFAAEARVKLEEIDVGIPVDGGEGELVERVAYCKLVRGPAHRIEAETRRLLRHRERDSGSRVPK